MSKPDYITIHHTGNLPEDTLKAIINACTLACEQVCQNEVEVDVFPIRDNSDLKFSDFLTTRGIQILKTRSAYTGFRPEFIAYASGTNQIPFFELRPNHGLRWQLKVLRHFDRPEMFDCPTAYITARSLLRSGYLMNNADDWLRNERPLVLFENGRLFNVEHSSEYTDYFNDPEVNKPEDLPYNEIEWRYKFRKINLDDPHDILNQYPF